MARRRGLVRSLARLLPHRGAQLNLARVGKETIACPFHGFELDAAGHGRVIPALGTAAKVPQNFRLTFYPVRESHGFVWLWWGDSREPEALPPIPWFDGIPAGLPSQTFRDPWAAHYSRAIENQLDVVHLPFVHHNTIDRGGKTLAHGPAVELEGDRLTVWMRNTVDDGSPTVSTG